MRLVVFSHKVCWKSEVSSLGYATDGGFVFHIQALASSYDETVLLVPVIKKANPIGEIPFNDKSLKIIPLLPPFGKGIWRKILFPIWFIWHLPKFLFYTSKSDIVHSPIPGDIGTIGMILAPVLGKKLFVRYCGNWFNLKTRAEKFWGWYAETYTGKSIAFICTGGDDNSPSKKNSHLKWIFSTSMLSKDMESYSSKKHDLNKEFTIVMGGRLTMEKGFLILIEAIESLIKKIPNLTVYIYGEGPDRTIFERHVKDKSLDQYIVFLGKLTSLEVHKTLTKADVFCFPTYSSEGFPKVLIEAMAHGIPVISTPVSVIPNLIGEKQYSSGILIEKHNKEMLAESILFYFNHPEIYNAHAINAKVNAAKYTLENWVDSINEILNNQWGTDLNRMKDIIR